MACFEITKRDREAAASLGEKHGWGRILATGWDAERLVPWFHFANGMRINGKSHVFQYPEQEKHHQ